MPNIVSAKKRVQVAKIKTLRNNMIKTSYKSAIRKFEEALLTKDLNLVETNFKNAISKIDKAKSKGVLKANTAARKKATLARKLNNNTK